MEEPSAEVALSQILPKILPDDVRVNIRPHDGLPALFKRLPERLRGYKHLIDKGQELKVIVLVDEDRVRPNCMERKMQLDNMAEGAGLITKTRAGQRGSFNVVVRLAIEELEAWFFGDPAAIHAAYPRVSATIGRKAAFRDPDAISGGTAERLFKVLQGAGYYKNVDRLPKIEVARNISAHMEPGRNQSRSFQVFRQGLGSTLD